MLIHQDHIGKGVVGIGKKTLHLKRLQDLGFLVPEFYALSSEQVEKIENDPAHIQSIVRHIQEKFNRSAYAVRSSAFQEDAQHESLAGQFHTEINVPLAEVGPAILKVIAQAKEFLGSHKNFSLIIQEYIQAEYAGVCFTRNPEGGREMVIEYHQGIGEDLVSGKILPKKVACYHQEHKKICGIDTAIFATIEKEFGFPQDVEWCTKDGVVYLLQTRSITTISQDQYKEILHLETQLPTGDFCFEKTEIAEIAPNPTPFTLSLLERIYGKDGPVMRVYKNHHISYIPQNFLKILGTEIFVDRDLEVKTLLPSRGILNPKYKVQFFGWKGIWTSLKNIITTVSMRVDISVYKRLQTALQRKEEPTSFQEALKLFLEEYAIIFETNVGVAKLLKKAEILLRKEPISFSDMLTMELKDIQGGENEVSWTVYGEERFLGNTLEIADEDPWYPTTEIQQSSESVKKRWHALPQRKKNMYKQALVQAVSSQKYREYARMLMVKNLSTLRRSVVEKSSFQNKKDIYFHTLSELEADTLDEQLCIQRRHRYEKEKLFTYPRTLTYHFLPQEKNVCTIGISSGVGEGRIVTEENFYQYQGPKILYTAILSPKLTKYFSDIQGIISENGGYLSHLAIIARERKLPIVVIQSKKDIHNGDLVRIHGNTGEIEKLTGIE